MQLRCPHCHNPFELAAEQSVEVVTCPGCGSTFSVIAAVSTQPYREPTARRIAQYELIETLGFGHFGTVWKARDTTLDRMVAVKVPRKEQLTDEESSQFQREARAAAQLRHPCIVAVHEVGQDGDTLYIVSDYVQGASLKEWIEDQRLAPREAAELMVKVSEALHHAHEAGVIHRDLKPANIMLDTAGEPKVMDFGLAKRESGEITMTFEGKVLGTPAYMSPEQARGEAHRADRRSDVYSLGVILFELLTGELPFRGEMRMLIVHILSSDPPRPCALDRHIPRDLETICLKCLEKAPQARYATARDLADDLRAFLDGRAITARPVGAMGRFWRLVKRNPWSSTLVGTILVLMGVALGTALQLGVVEGERDTAQGQLAQSYVEQGRLLLARGKARDAVELFKLALDDGVPDEFSVRLSLIEALTGLGELERAESELDALSQSSEAARQKGLIQMWQAEFLLRLHDDRDGAIEFYKQALQHDLPAGEKLYIEGMLEETSPEALERFEAALEEAPFNERALLLVCTTLSFLGEVERAERQMEVYSRLFPEHLHIRRAFAMLLALSDLDNARTVAADAALFSSDEERQDFVRMLELANLAAQASLYLPGQPPPGDAPTLRDWGLLLSYPERVRPLQESWLPLPPKVAARADGIMDAIVGGTRMGEFDAAAEELESFLEVNPEGFLFTLQGHYLLAQQKYAEAAEAYRLALESPSLVASAHNVAEIGLALTLSSEWVSDITDEDALENALDAVRVILDGRPLPPQMPHICTVVAFKGGDLLLARQGIRAWEPLVEENDEMFLRRRMQIEDLDGEYFKALQLANALLEINPEQPDALEIRERALQAIEEIRPPSNDPVEPPTM